MPTRSQPMAPTGEVPCPEALLASTLTYMTAHAQACCDHHRTLITRAVTDNLALLAEHPLLSPPFRGALWELGVQWRRMAAPAAAPRPVAQLHAAPGTLQ